MHNALPRTLTPPLALINMVISNTMSGVLVLDNANGGVFVIDNAMGRVLALGKGSNFLVMPKMVF